MLESMYWQTIKGASYLQFLCDIDRAMNVYYLENEMMHPAPYYEGRPVMRSFACLILLRNLEHGINWIYDHYDGEEFFMNYLAIEEH